MSDRSATASAGASPPTAPRAGLGLLAIFGSTLFQLSGIFMLSPLLLLLLKKADVSTTIAGLFAATSWLGVFLITPFAAQLTKRMGRRNALWLASGLPLVTAVGFLATDNLAVWFALELLASVAGGLRWVLAEAFIAEFAPRQHMGRYIGMYATMIGLTFVIGPSALAWVGADSPVAAGIAQTYELVHKGYDDWLQAKLGALRGDAAPSAPGDAAPAAPGQAPAP